MADQDGVADQGSSATARSALADRHGDDVAFLEVDEGRRQRVGDPLAFFPAHARVEAHVALVRDARNSFLVRVCPGRLAGADHAEHRGAVVGVKRGRDHQDLGLVGFAGDPSNQLLVFQERRGLDDGNGDSFAVAGVQCRLGRQQQLSRDALESRDVQAAAAERAVQHGQRPEIGLGVGAVIGSREAVAVDGRQFDRVGQSGGQRVEWGQDRFLGLVDLEAARRVRNGETAGCEDGSAGQVGGLAAFAGRERARCDAEGAGARKRLRGAGRVIRAAWAGLDLQVLRQDDAVVVPAVGAAVRVVAAHPHAAADLAAALGSV